MTQEGGTEDRTDDRTDLARLGPDCTGAFLLLLLLGGLLGCGLLASRRGLFLVFAGHSGSHAASKLVVRTRLLKHCTQTHNTM